MASSTWSIERGDHQTPPSCVLWMKSLTSSGTWDLPALARITPATLEHVSSAQGRTALFTTLLRQASASVAGVLGAKIQVGEVGVADVNNLENMLGSTPERGHAITAAHNGQFLMLENPGHFYCDIHDGNREENQWEVAFPLVDEYTDGVL
ncbi:hypothetical protein EMCRGX_G021630 [Ephydatia muelleri]